MGWLWDSRQDGPEAIPKSHFSVAQRVYPGPSTIHLASTLALVVRLAMHLRQQQPSRVFCLCLDNLFLNINVANTLLALDFCYMGTTPNNAMVPQLTHSAQRAQLGTHLEFYTCCSHWFCVMYVLVR
jgi:hypothetical protein